MPWAESTSPGKVEYVFKTVIAAMPWSSHGGGLDVELRADLEHSVRPSARGATWEAAAGAPHGSTPSAAAAAAVAKEPAADDVWLTLRAGEQMYAVGAGGRAARGARGRGEEGEDSGEEAAGEEDEFLPRSGRKRPKPRRRATLVAYLDSLSGESNISLLRWWLVPFACVAIAFAACAFYALFRTAARQRAIEAEASLQLPRRILGWEPAAYPRTCGRHTLLPLAARFYAAAVPGAGDTSDADLSTAALQRFNMQACQYAALDIWRALARSQNVTRWAVAGGALVGAECFASLNPWSPGIDLHVAWSNAGALADIWGRAEAVPKWKGIGGQAWDARAVSVDGGHAALLLKTARRGAEHPNGTWSGTKRVVYRLYALPLSASSPTEGA